MLRVITASSVQGEPDGGGSPGAQLRRRLYSHRGLILQLTLLEILGRYRGSYIGPLWTFITPFLMLALYTFVFGAVFKARWHQTRQEGGFSVRDICNAVGLGLQVLFFATPIIYPLIAVPERA